MATLDRVFDLLSAERRRYALYYLEQADGPVPVDELAEQVAEWTTDAATASVSDDEFENVKVELHHRDLPKADEVEYVEYDRESREVEVAGAPPEFDAVLSVARVIERPNRNP
ncbi:DUF7344 domain-containing protein [Halorussus halobius]|uniref:DUF7344 domain-containing protein n=1 Tax=Halorussus halobius TaxID=1710537 RepID=UPI001092F06C|nr:hypothetical protein [Halorussus halobius]